MGVPTMPLTDAKIKNLKPQEKAKKYADMNGLSIEVMPNGRKIWRYQYRLPGRKSPKEYTIGHYPGVSLADARTKREEAEKLVKAGKDPVQVRAVTRLETREEADNTFAKVAKSWFDAQIKNRSQGYQDQVWGVLQADVFPEIGKFPIREIQARHVFKILQTVHGRGAEILAVNIRQWVSRIFCFAVALGMADFDPAGALRGMLDRPAVSHARAIPRDELKELYRRLRKYGGNRLTVLAIRLMLYTFLRTTEMRRSEWSELDYDARLWDKPAEHMKMKRRHLVPLADQVIVLLEEIRMLSGNCKNLFPNSRRPKDVMSLTTINRALEHMGFPPGFITGHDFRATASTHLREMNRFNPEAIERQLAHAETNSSKKPYNHAEYLDERRRFMQAWADWLDAIEAEVAAEPVAAGVDPRAPVRAGHDPVDRACPHCGSMKVNRQGVSAGKPRYRCANPECLKTFNDNTIKRLAAGHVA